MDVPISHIRHQGRVIASLGLTVVDSIKNSTIGRSQPALPGKTFESEIPPRDPGLVDDLIKFSGGNPETYKNHLPAYFFPQWSVPLLAKTIKYLPYNLTKIMNAGCKITINEPLKLSLPLKNQARLESVDENKSRVLIKQSLIIGHEKAPESVVVEQSTIILKNAKSGGKKKPLLIPVDATEIGRANLAKKSGLNFALLTGDFNPLHWVTPYAKAFGYSSPILHGFATMSLAIEQLNKNVFGGDPSLLKEIDVKFSRPLRLPAKIAFFTKDDTVYVGYGAGSKPFLVGTFKASSNSTIH